MAVNTLIGEDASSTMYFSFLVSSARNSGYPDTRALSYHKGSGFKPRPLALVPLHSDYDSLALGSPMEAGSG